MKQWLPIENEEDYEATMARYEKIRKVKKGMPEQKEKMLLVTLVTQYEENLWDLPEVNPIEMIRLRMEDFGYKPADLAKEYGD